MRKSLAFVAAAFIAVGCTPGEIVSNGSTGAVNTVNVSATQALILANLTYQTVATPVAVGMEQGVITGENKTRLKALSAKVAKTLADAKAAKTDAERAALASQALGDLDTISALSGVPLPKF